MGIKHMTENTSTSYKTTDQEVEPKMKTTNWHAKKSKTKLSNNARKQALRKYN